MSARVYDVLAYTLAGVITTTVAFLASLPFTDPLAILAVTADAACLVGWPLLLLTDHITTRLGGHA